MSYQSTNTLLSDEITKEAHEKEQLPAPASIFKARNRERRQKVNSTTTVNDLDCENEPLLKHEGNDIGISSRLASSHNIAS